MKKLNIFINEKSNTIIEILLLNGIMNDFNKFSYFIYIGQQLMRQSNC